MEKLGSEEQKENKPVDVLVIDKDNLNRINKSRTQEQQILSAIGMLEAKKFEMIAQVGQIRKNLEDTIKSSLSNIGIEGKDFPNYAINPNTGEAIKK